jgi:hypothetical protein
MNVAARNVQMLFHYKVFKAEKKKLPIKTSEGF